MREALVDVFVDDVDVVEDEVAFDEHRELAVRAQLQELRLHLFGNALKVDRLDFEFTALLVQNDAAHVGEGARRSRVKRHHGGTYLAANGKKRLPSVARGMEVRAWDDRKRKGYHFTEALSKTPNF